MRPQKTGAFQEAENVQSLITILCFETLHFYLFIYLFIIHSLFYLFFNYYFHSLIHIYSFIHSFVRAFIHSFIHSVTYLELLSYKLLHSVLTYFH